jgi:ribonuclease D
MEPGRPVVTEVPASVPEAAQIGLPRPPDVAGRRIATLADSPARFTALLEALYLARPRAFGLDTETANFERGGLYRESPSLLQLAFRRTEGDVRVAVIDLLAIRDVRPLQPFLIHPTAVVFAHNYAYDGRMLTRLGLRPRCVYDTCRAARVLYEGAGRLADLSERLLGTPMAKEMQVSDWGRRPLSREQIAYAARDAADTLVIGEIVRQILPELPDGLPALPPGGRAAYRALVAWRAEVAGAARVYPEDVLPQRTLREVAIRRPATPGALRQVPGIGDTRLERYGAGVLTTLAAVELASLVAGTVLSGLRVSAADLADDGIHLRLSGLDPAAPTARAVLAAAPQCVRAALETSQPWRMLRPALAGLRLGCAVEDTAANGEAEGMGRVLPLFTGLSV